MSICLSQQQQHTHTHTSLHTTLISHLKTTYFFIKIVSHIGGSFYPLIILVSFSEPQEILRLLPESWHKALTFC